MAIGLATNPEVIERVCRDPRSWYRQVSIPKRRGRGRRILYIANDELRAIHKQIRDALSSHCTFPEYVRGFVRGGSIASNARCHLAKRIILNLDVRSFFESIGIEALCAVFSQLGAVEKFAQVYAQVCACDGHLVPGTVCAPILSNLAFAKCDLALKDLASIAGSGYTRYVDDITFSGDTVPGLADIDSVLADHGFTRNVDKTRLQKRGRHQYVTGLTVFDGAIPRIPKRQKDQFRQSLYFMKKYGIIGHISRANPSESPDRLISKFDGLIKFYNSIESHFTSQHAPLWQEIKERHRHSMSEDERDKTSVDRHQPEVVIVTRPHRHIGQSDSKQ